MQKTKKNLHCQVPPGTKKTPQKHPVSLIHAAASLPLRPQILAREVRAVESDLSDVLLSCVVHTPEEGPAPNSNMGYIAWGINLKSNIKLTKKL